MEIVIATLLIVAAALLRLLPHAPNFAPIAALALFGGVVLPRRWSLVIPFGAMILSDAVIGFYELPVMMSVYACFILTTVLGWWIKKQQQKGSIVVGISIFSSFVFFVVTNFAVWAWGHIYPHTAAGLLTSYAMGVPFFRNTLMSDLFYSGLLFGLYAVVTVTVRHFHWFRDRRIRRAPR